MKEIHTRLNDQQSGEFKLRLNVLIAFILLAFFLIILRLGYLQIVEGSEYRQKSENNSIRLRKIKPTRGLIMDANRHLLADNQPSFEIYFAPNRMKNTLLVMEVLQELYKERNLDFDLDKKLLLKAGPFTPVRLERNIGWEKVATVETNALDLPGLFVEVTPIRHYYEGEIFSHITGYTGEITEQELERRIGEDYRSGDSIGKQGIEKYLDPYLRGKSGAEQIEVNVFGRKVRSLGMMPPSPGYNVQLTIDSFMQKAAWKAIDGKIGSLVVMDPRDGGILAMVSFPSFDDNLFNGGISYADWDKLSNDPRNPMENRVVAGQYPPGSTYKLIVAAAALEEGVITPEKPIFCNGTYELGNRLYRCWKKEGHGWVNLHRAIVESCDVYFYNLGKMLGVDKIAQYARQFGFGSLTGIDLSPEKSGLIPTKKWKLARFGEPWQIGETISISIGQGYNLVTPIQLVNAYSAFANGGTLFRPRLIKQIERVDGTVFKRFGPEKIGSLPFGEKTFELLNHALWGAVNEPAGTGYALKRKEEDVSGKTGTAQVISLPEDQRLRRAKKIAYRHQDHALFVGYAPYKSPEIAVAVILENAGSGGSEAAPVVRKVIDAYFSKKKNEPEDRRKHP